MDLLELLVQIVIAAIVYLIYTTMKSIQRSVRTLEEMFKKETPGERPNGPGRSASSQETPTEDPNGPGPS